MTFYHAFTGCDYICLFNRKREDKAVQTSQKISCTSRSIPESVALWRYILWHQINHRVLCVANVWKKEDKLSQSSTSRDLCYQVKTKKRICFSQPNWSREVGFKHNGTVFQSLTWKDQTMYLCCKHLNELAWDGTNTTSSYIIWLDVGWRRNILHQMVWKRYCTKDCWSG